MHLRSLTLTNYRNFRQLALTLDDGPTVIQGENGEGKTNLLEAVELLATTKSARSGSDRELIHWAVQGQQNGIGPGDAFARISAVVAHEGRDSRADVLLRLSLDAEDETTPAVSKAFRLNGAPRRAVDFVGQINVVSFSPDDVALVGGSPGGRRRYLDVTNAQMSRRYLRALQRYNKVLLQRNHLLRQMRETGRVDPSLGVWNEELAENGAFLVLERARTVAELSAGADEWFHQLGGWGERLEVRYRPALGDGPPPGSISTLSEAGPEAVKEAFQHALERAAPRERAAGISLVGPHRDDFTFLVDGIDLHVYGSRGQQRLGALSLKLAEVGTIDHRVGSRPIILLDDVLSELDRRRQEAVLRIAGGPGQTILTLTSLDFAGASSLPAADIYCLSGGAVHRRERSEVTPSPLPSPREGTGEGLETSPR